MYNTVDIIIVNWNSGHQLQICLESINKIMTADFELTQVVIVDNASTDESLKGSKYMNLPFRFVNNSNNRGFATACNQGALGSTADFLLFLNPDTILFDNSLSKPIAFMQLPTSSDVGIVGIQLVDENSHIARSCSRFPSAGIIITQALGLNRLPGLKHLSQAMIEWDHTSTRQVDQVIGAFFLVRRSVFVSLNGFDERFFVYFEEVDLSLRARQMGWRSVYLTDSQAFHAGCGTSDQVKAKRLFYSLRSRILYGYKHFSFFSASMTLMATLCIEPFARLTLANVRLSVTQISEIFKAYLLLFKDLPHIFRKINS